MHSIKHLHLPLNCTQSSSQPAHSINLPPRSIVGKRVDSSKSQNFLASVTADAARGDTRLRVGRGERSEGPSQEVAWAGLHQMRLGRDVPSPHGDQAWLIFGLVGLSASPLPHTAPSQVSSTNPFRVGQWVRIWVRTPGNQKLPTGRRLLAADVAAAAPAPAPSSGPPALPLRLFDDPYLAAAVASAAAAENAAAAAAAAAGPEGPNPGTVFGQSADPAVQAAAEEAADAALNPLNLEPMVRAAARHAFDAVASEISEGDVPPALLAELAGRAGAAAAAPANSTAPEDPERVPALAVAGSLDYYLYGDNAQVDSGENYSECGPALLRYRPPARLPLHPAVV